MSQASTAVAPGKIILFGEHSVVYNRPAVAVPVNQVKATCRIEAGGSGHGIHIEAMDLGQRFRLHDLDDTNPLAAAILKTLPVCHQTAIPDLTLYVSSTIPIARGLGSGAAVSTAIVRALSQRLDCTLDNQAISEIVYQVEKIHHGTPSGIDNTVVAFAQPIFFQRGRPITRLWVKTPLTFIIGDTGIQSPTHKVVGDLRLRREADVERYEGFFDDMAAIAREARSAIEQGRVSAVGKCMLENQSILQTLGISSPELNHLVEVAMAHNALGAKLSGAGWGGNMIALVWPNQADEIRKALHVAGAVHTIVTTVT